MSFQVSVFMKRKDRNFIQKLRKRQFLRGLPMRKALRKGTEKIFLFYYLLFLLTFKLHKILKFSDLMIHSRLEEMLFFSESLIKSASLNKNNH